MTTYCATGHRPNKLGGYTKAARFNLRKLAYDFLKQDTPDRVLSGMALGWDMAWAEAAIALGIPTIAAVPFKGQEKMWPKESQDRFNTILNGCSEIVVVSEGDYKPYLMQIRNEFMVNQSDKVIALWDGTAGGTGNCIRYANKVCKPVINLYEEYQTYAH